MSRTGAFLARAVVLVVGLLTGGAGALLLAWQFDIASMASRVAVPDTTGWPESAWWPWALGASFVVLLCLGLGIIIGVLFRRSIGTRTLDGSCPDGALSADLEAVASASAQCFAALDGVSSARYRLRLRHSTPTVEIIVHGSAEVSPAQLAQASQVNATAMDAAFGSSVAQRVYLHVEPVSG